MSWITGEFCGLLAAVNRACTVQRPEGLIHQKCVLRGFSQCKIGFRKENKSQVGDVDRVEDLAPQIGTGRLVEEKPNP